MMFNIGVGLLNRISTLLALKALPDEAALHSHLRNAVKGIFFLVLGSVLLGAAITASLYAAYECLLENGYPRSNTLIIVLGTAFVLIAICFVLAGKWLCLKPKSKNIIDEKLDYIRDIASESASGFIEGLLYGNKTKGTRRKS